MPVHGGGNGDAVGRPEKRGLYEVEVTRRFPALATSPRAARQFVRGVLDARPDDETHLLASVLTSELVTNAVVHARTDLDVRVAVAPDELRVEVSDGSPLVPAPRQVADDANSGRGLHLVDRLARSWGVEPAAAGKTVWFTLDSPLSA